MRPRGAVPSDEGAGNPVAGARSLGDPLLPRLGNGGYDVQHDTIELDYDPVANNFQAATTTIQAVASETLKEFSLDFQDTLGVRKVTVDGRPAGFRFEAATPQLSTDPVVTQPMKLVVSPSPSRRPTAGREFTTVVHYQGSPQPITDPDTSLEGWIQACFPLSPPRSCDGAFVVNEPKGALAAINASLAQAPAQLNFLSGLFGPYPFDSTRAVADRAAGVGYALEVQTKAHHAGGFTSGNPAISIGTQLHELAHQWMGNTATLETWSDIWFNEGWATWSTWYWSHSQSGGTDPAAIFDDLYTTTPAEDWAIAPAVLDGDPANMFLSSPHTSAAR
jgi:hypothetical protein